MRLLHAADTFKKINDRKLPVGHLMAEISVISLLW